MTTRVMPYNLSAMLMSTEGDYCYQSDLLCLALFSGTPSFRIDELCSYRP